MEDDRFNVINQDPRFRQIPKAERKVKIDRRFEGMFKDKRFKLKYSVDKRGRPLSATTDDNLRRFYQMSDSESSDESDDEDEDAQGQKIKKKSKNKNIIYEKDKLNKNLVKDKPRKLKSSLKKEKLDGAKKSKGQQQEESRKSEKPSDVNFNEKFLVLSVNQQGKISKASKQVKKRKSKKKSKPMEQSKKISHVIVCSEEEMSEGSEEDSSDESCNEKEEGGSDSNSSDLSEPEKDLRTPAIPGPDLIRGEGNVESSSSSDSSSDSEAEEGGQEGEEIEHGWGELDKDAPRDERVTSRLAVCNMDWDRVKAQDILVLFNSFKPTGGAIKCVKIYPSEYGLQRMKEEDVKGPLELLDHEAQEKSNVDQEEGDQYHRERLRKYQMQRLKYFYAVVECDSKSTASTVYEQCDGLEYQSSSTQIDLRFIPEDMTFDDHKPKDVATEMPDTALYKPVEFRTTALHQSKVELTWDETDHVREKKTLSAFGEKDFEEADVKAYLASSSGEEDDIATPAFEIEEEFGGTEDVDDEKQISRYRALLQGIDEKEAEEKEEKEMGVEITWEPGLKETAEELVKKKIETEAGLTPWEKFLEKKKEKKRQKREQKKSIPKEVGATESTKEQQEQAAFSDDDLPADVDLEDAFFKDSLRDNESTQSAGKKTKRKRKKQEALTADKIEEQQQKKAELELLMMDEDDNKQHFNLKDIMEKEKGSASKKRKRKRQEKDSTKQEDNFQIDVKDSRFEAIYTSHLYAIDPSDSQYRKTKAMEALVKEKQQRRAKKDTVDGTHEGKERRKKERIEEKKSSGVKKDQELSVLVKSIKSKTQQFNARKSKKEVVR